MPLSDHEQRILQEIEKKLREEDPRLADAVSRASPYTHAVRRIRLGALAFVAGFVMLMLFPISIWIAIVGFGLMLSAALFVYQLLKSMGRDQLREAGRGPRLSPATFLARLTERFRHRGTPGEPRGTPGE